MKRKITLLVLSTVLVLTIIISSTYSALFKVDETEVQSYETGILQITSSSTSNSVTLTNSLPMSDADGIISTPYTFKIANTGTLAYKFDVKFLSTTTDTTNMIDSRYIKIKVNNDEVITLNSLTNGVILSNQTLEPGESLDIILRVWLTDNTPNTEIGKVFSAKVTTEGEAIYTKENYALNTLTKLGLTNLVRDGEPSFEVAAKADEGIYKAEDDLGISYYFRGASENNYVKFGKYGYEGYRGYPDNIPGYFEEFYTLEECKSQFNTCISYKDKDIYWRIIRINGDGTIRMIYTDLDVVVSGMSPGLFSLMNDFYTSIDNPNAKIGYMYGTTLESSYELEHSNSVNSVVKDFLEEKHPYVDESGMYNSTINGLSKGWYEINIVDTGYSDYVADAIYCNDRSLVTDSSKYLFFNNDATIGTGFGESFTLYGIWSRIELNSDYEAVEIKPSLKCIIPNDRFTKTVELGNGDLRYPVGLITADEAIFGGMTYNRGECEYNNYLAGISSWTMTPSNSNSIFLIENNGCSVIPEPVSGMTAGIRPVISLKADALKYDTATSNGSMEHPFVIAD